MHDIVFDAAKRNDCILALTPDNGGSWISSFKPRTYRNYYINPSSSVGTGEPFSDLKTILLTTNFSYQDDFKFEFTINLIDNDYPLTQYFSFYQSDGRIQSFWGRRESDGYMRFNFSTSVLTNSDIFFDYIPFVSGLHKVVIELIGDTFSVTVDGENKQIIGTRKDGSSDPNRVINFNAPANILSAKLTNLTSNSVLWTAGKDVLYNSIVYPYEKPKRNFSETGKDKSWYDIVSSGYNNIGVDDCEFYIEYENYKDYPGQIFYSNSQNGSINIYFIENNQNSYTSFQAFNDNSIYLYPNDSSEIITTGKHKILFRRENGTATAYIDGILKSTVISSSGNKLLYGTSVPISNLNGTIYKAYLKNLRTGKTVWLYPTEIERLNLADKINYRCDRGVFEQASSPSSTINTRIDTQLDLRGSVSDYTVIVDFDAAIFNGIEQKQELAGQGPCITAAQRPEICSLAYYSRSVSNSYALQCAQEINGVRVNCWKETGLLTGRHSAAGRITVNNNNTTTISIFLDGNKIIEQNYQGVPRGTAYTTHTCYSISDNRNGLWVAKYNKIYSVLLFNSSLSDYDIKQISFKG